MQSFARLLSAFALLSVALADVTAASDAAVEIRRLPEGGVQPQVVVDTHGVLHAVYLSGDPKSADVFYVRSQDWARTFSEPRRVNSLAGSATAAGAIRGAQLAAGRGGRVHVAWNGSSLARPRAPLNPEMPSDSPHNGTPMLYSRLGDDGLFEPQRNLMTRTFGLDGGGSIAADAEGHVYVAWHAKKRERAMAKLGDESGWPVRWMTESTLPPSGRLSKSQPAHAAVAACESSPTQVGRCSGCIDPLAMSCTEISTCWLRPITARPLMEGCSIPGKSEPAR